MKRDLLGDGELRGLYLDGVRYRDLERRWVRPNLVYLVDTGLQGAGMFRQLVIMPVQRTRKA